MKDINGLRELFLKYLTQDSEQQDRRRKESNQAIFNAKEGWAVFNGTDRDMVMEKIDKAVKGISVRRSNEAYTTETGKC